MSLARQIVGFAIKAGSSDIHLEEGSPIAIRINSDTKSFLAMGEEGKEETGDWGPVDMVVVEMALTRPLT